MTEKDLQKVIDEKIDASQSSLPIKLTLRRKGIELVVEGTLSSIYKELDALADFAKKVEEQIERLKRSACPEIEREVAQKRIAWVKENHPTTGKQAHLSPRQAFDVRPHAAPDHHRVRLGHACC